MSSHIRPISFSGHNSYQRHQRSLGRTANIGSHLGFLLALIAGTYNHRVIRPGYDELVLTTDQACEATKNNAQPTDQQVTDFTTDFLTKYHHAAETLNLGTVPWIDNLNTKEQRLAYHIVRDYCQFRDQHGALDSVAKIPGSTQAERVIIGRIANEVFSKHLAPEDMRQLQDFINTTLGTTTETLKAPISLLLPLSTESALHHFPLMPSRLTTFELLLLGYALLLQLKANLHYKRSMS